MLFVSIKDVERQLNIEYAKDVDLQSIIADFKIIYNCLYVFRFPSVSDESVNNVLETIFGEAKENDKIHLVAERSVTICIRQSNSDSPKVFSDKMLKDAYYSYYMGSDENDDERKFNKTIAFTSSIYEREKVIYLLNYVKDLNELDQKCFIVDADGSSPLLTTILEEWDDPKVSFLDVNDLIYEENFENNASLVSFVANKTLKYGMNQFLPFYKNVSQLFDTGDSFFKLTRNHDFSFYDILKRIKSYMNCDYLIVNASCGMNSWVEPFLFDSNFCKINIEKSERCSQVSNLSYYISRYVQNDNNHFQHVYVDNLEFFDSDDDSSSKSAYKKFFEVKS